MRRSNFVVAFALALLIPALVDAQTPAPDAPRTPERTVDRDDDTDWGWIGLLGLVGLAGLIPRDRNRTRVATGTHR